MLEINRILVAVGEFGRKPPPQVLKAAQLARACGATIELFHSLAQPVCLDYSDMDDVPGFDLLELMKQRALAKLELVADRLRAHSIKVSVSVAWDYPAYQGIIRRAERVKADIVIAGCHGGRHRAARILRLTDWELVRWCPVPVLLVKDAHPYRHPKILAAIDPTHAFAKPLKLDREILRIAASMSKRLGGSLHAVHAYLPVSLQGIPPEGVTGRQLNAIATQSRKLAKGRFETALRGFAIGRDRRHLSGAHPMEAIAATARDERIAVVVMGAISRRWLRGLVIGNTAERALDALSCDLLVVKPPGFRRRISKVEKGPRLIARPPGSYY